MSLRFILKIKTRGPIEKPGFLEKPGFWDTKKRGLSIVN
jgi:hypothetical protein